MATRTERIPAAAWQGAKKPGVALTSGFRSSADFHLEMLDARLTHGWHHLPRQNGRHGSARHALRNTGRPNAEPSWLGGHAKREERN